MKTVPERIFASHAEEAIIVEYYSSHCNNDTEKTPEVKQIKILAKGLHEDADISKIAKKIIKKCKQIPSNWVSQVEDILVELQQRSFDLLQESDVEEDQRGTVVDHALDILYESDGNQVEAVKNIHGFCVDFSSLELLSQNHQLLSAFARLLANCKSCEEVKFYICKVILYLSDFEEFHVILQEYRIGSIIMTLAREIVSEMEQLLESGNHGVSAAKCDSILYICLGILSRLSDDIDVHNKMIRKYIYNVLDDCLCLRLSTDTMGKVLFLLDKASIYGETIDYFTSKESNLWYTIPSILQNGSHEMVDLCIGILYNASFNEECRSRILESNLLSLIPLYTSTENGLKLLFQLSKDAACVMQLLIPEAKNSITEKVREGLTSTDTLFYRILANLTKNSFWAEEMIPFVEQFLECAKNSKIAASILSNLSTWTKNVQHCIFLAVETNDPSILASVTCCPENFVVDEETKSEWTSGPFERYKSLKYWSRASPDILSTCNEGKIDTHVLIEFLRTLSNFTCNDLPLSSSWCEILLDFDTTAKFKEIIGQDGSDGDILKASVLTFCTQLCIHWDCAKLFADSHLLHDLIALGDNETGESEIVFRILCLCESYLSCKDLRGLLIFGTNILDLVFISLQNENYCIYQQARVCLDLLCSNNENDDGISTLCQERRFSLHNDEWIKRNTI